MFKLQKSVRLNTDTIGLFYFFKSVQAFKHRTPLGPVYRITFINRMNKASIVEDVMTTNRF